MLECLPEVFFCHFVAVHVVELPAGLLPAGGCRAHYASASSSTSSGLICISSVEIVSPRACETLICNDLTGTDSRLDDDLPEMYNKEVMGVNVSESAAPAAAPANTPESNPATAASTNAAQSPVPAPITAQGAASAPITRVESPLSIPGEASAPLFAASGPAPVFGFGSAGADRHACPASDEAPQAHQEAGMLLSQLGVCTGGHAACLHHGPTEQCILRMDP